jgi:hypothetical protein
MGSWIAVLVLTVYAAILVASWWNPSTDDKLEAMNYFTDTLLFAGAVLAVARAT